MERDTVGTSAELTERKIVRTPPEVSLQEMLLAFKDVLARSDMFAHHHVNRERLSVRQRMVDILSSLGETAFMEFVRLFRPEEGRMGVTVTFIAILELMKEGLIEIVQSEPYAPIHVRPGAGSRRLSLVSAATAGSADPDAENAAALAQPVPEEELADEDAEEPDSDLAEIADEAELTPETDTLASPETEEHNAVDDGAPDADAHDVVETGMDPEPDRN
jgi:segregation and condensation protein A